MRVVVTRPAVAAQRTADRIRALGHEPILLPLFQPEHDTDAVRHALADNPSGLILTSAEAVRSMKQTQIADAGILSLPVYAVGEATAEAAAALGFGHVSVSGGNGMLLADHIADRHDRNGGMLLYLAGEPRSQGLEERLRQRGLAVAVVTAYRMETLPYSPEDLAARLMRTEPPAVLLYSRETAIRFAALVAKLDGAALSIDRILCLSRAIAAALPPPLAAKACAADEPREDRLLALLPSTMA